MNEQDNNNIDIGENNNWEREVANDEDKFDSQAYDIDLKYIKRINGLTLLSIEK